MRPCSDDRVYPRLHSRAVGDVYTGEEGALAEGGGGFAAGCFVQVTEGDGGPFGNELLRRGPAVPAAPPVIRQTLSCMVMLILLAMAGSFTLVVA